MTKFFLDYSITNQLSPVKKEYKKRIPDEKRFKNNKAV